MSVQAPLRVFEMSPSAILDFGFNWAEWLGSDTIATSNWTADAGVTPGAGAKTASLTYVIITAGAVAGVYDVTNSIVTSAGKADSRTFRIVVVQR